MGFTYADVRTCDPADRGKNRDVKLLVESGAVYTLIRGDQLEELRIMPEAKRRFKLADGKIIERRFGAAIIECKKESAGTLVILGEPYDTEVLGVHALEGLGFELDLVTKELKPMTLFLV